MSALESILENEGFRSKPYQDSLGVWTFGHGLTYITQLESTEIVKFRIRQITERLQDSITDFNKLPDSVQEVLIEMAYQMGVMGLLGFKNMLDAIERGNYVKAAQEGLNSKWAEQTPHRANRLMNKLLSAQL